MYLCNLAEKGYHDIFVTRSMCTAWHTVWHSDCLPGYFHH